MSKYYRVVGKTLIAKLDEWAKRRQEASDAMLRLSRRVGASRTRLGAFNGIASRGFGFFFANEPDKKLWKKKDVCWVPKHSSKEGKRIAKEMRQIEQSDAHVAELGNMIGLDFLQSPGLRHINGTFYFKVGDDWKLKTQGLRRISDVTMERLEASESEA